MNLERKTKFINLYNIYYELLSTRQQQITELFLDEDYSVSEIASKLKVTPPAISKTLKQVEEKLFDLESKLKIKSNYDFNITLLNKNNVDLQIIKKIK